MALKVEVGTFIREATGIPNATQTVTLVDTTLTPKAIILWLGGIFGEGFAIHKTFSFGMASGALVAENRGIAGTAPDGASPSLLNVRYDDGCFLAGTEFPDVKGRINAFGAGSFQMIYPVNGSFSVSIHYLVIGGDDLTNAKVREFAAPTAAGNRDDTGFGFQPDCILLLWQGVTALGNVTNGRFGIGAARSSTKRWAMANTGQDGQTMTGNLGAVSAQRSDSCFLQLTVAAAPVIDGRSGFVGFIADGYTLDWIDAPAAALLYAVLALKGGQVDVGVFAKSTGGAPATQDVTSVGFQPKGYVLVSRDQVAGTTVNGNSELAVGAADDGGREVSAWGNINDNAVPIQSDTRLLTANVFSLNRSDAGGGVAESTADHQLMLSNGFRVIWNPNEAVAKEICYLAFGDAPPAPSADDLATKLLLLPDPGRPPGMLLISGG